MMMMHGCPGQLWQRDQHQPAAANAVSSGCGQTLPLVYPVGPLPLPASSRLRLERVGMSETHFQLNARPLPHLPRHLSSHSRESPLPPTFLSRHDDYSSTRTPCIPPC